ncbi:SWIM zinc finger family protein [Pseudonocardia saturnea]
MSARGFPAFPARTGRRGRSWWAREFVAALEDAALDAGVLRRGRRFAGSGRLGPVTVAPGRVSAVADDPDDGLVRTVVHLAELDDDGWRRLLDQVAAESGHLAALLDGEVPRTLVEAADAAGVSLLPGIGELESECDCPEVGDPCPHSAALCYQVSWLLDDDPFLLLLLRGRTADELVGAPGRASPGTDDPLDRPVTPAEAAAAPERPLPPDPPLRRYEPPLLVAPPGMPDGALTSLAEQAAARAAALLGG